MLPKCMSCKELDTTWQWNNNKNIGYLESQVFFILFLNSCLKEKSPFKSKKIFMGTRISISVWSVAATAQKRGREALPLAQGQGR